MHNFKRFGAKCVLPGFWPFETGNGNTKWSYSDGTVLGPSFDYSVLVGIAAMHQERDFDDEHCTQFGCTFSEFQTQAGQVGVLMAIVRGFARSYLRFGFAGFAVAIVRCGPVNDVLGNVAVANEVELVVLGSPVDTSSVGRYGLMWIFGCMSNVSSISKVLVQ